MLLSLRADQKEHLRLLARQSIDVIIRFCKLTREFLHREPAENFHELAADELHMDAETVEKCIFSLANLLLQSYKHKLSEADFRDSILTLGFHDEKQSILYEFYKVRLNEMHGFMGKQTLQEDHYSDMEWRFEVQVASRCLQQQVNPLLTLDLSLQSSNDAKKSQLLQTDPTNLLHITNKLKSALAVSRTPHARKIQNALLNS